MHVFQPADTEFLEFNPFKKIGEDWMLVTSGDEKKANTMTASWGGMGVIWGKNVVYIFVRESRYTKEFIDATHRFSLSFPEEKYRKEMKFLGAVSGRDEDKISEAGIHIGYHDGVPYIDEANLVLICDVMSATPINAEDFIDKTVDGKWYADKDYHTMYVGEIKQVLMR